MSLREWLGGGGERKEEGESRHSCANERDVHECGRELKEKVKKGETGLQCVYPKSLSGGRGHGAGEGVTAGSVWACEALVYLSGPQCVRPGLRTLLEYFSCGEASSRSEFRVSRPSAVFCSREVRKVLFFTFFTFFKIYRLHLEPLSSLGFQDCFLLVLLTQPSSAAFAASFLLTQPAPGDFTQRFSYHVFKCDFPNYGYSQTSFLSSDLLTDHPQLHTSLAFLFPLICSFSCSSSLSEGLNHSLSQVWTRISFI